MTGYKSGSLEVAENDGPRPQYLPELQMGDRYLPLVGKRVPAARAGRYRPGMRRSIATVSLSGTLNEKLTAVANAGFDGVEIFENDLIAFPGSPREVGQMIRDLGLTCTLFQPFRDFEGLPGELRSRAFDRAERKVRLLCAD